jgi:hypothetical protein
MVDILLVVRDDGTAAARGLRDALRDLVEQRLPSVPGLVCAWGGADAHERSYRDRVIDIELRGDGTDRRDASGPRSRRCGDERTAHLERVFDALVGDLRAAGLLSRGA